MAAAAQAVAHALAAPARQGRHRPAPGRLRLRPRARPAGPTRRRRPGAPLRRRRRRAGPRAQERPAAAVALVSPAARTAATAELVLADGHCPSPERRLDEALYGADPEEVLARPPRPARRRRWPPWSSGTTPRRTSLSQGLLAPRDKKGQSAGGAARLPHLCPRRLHLPSRPVGGRGGRDGQAGRPDGPALRRGRGASRILLGDGAHPLEHLFHAGTHVGPAVLATSQGADDEPADRGQRPGDGVGLRDRRPGAVRVRHEAIAPFHRAGELLRPGEGEGPPGIDLCDHRLVGPRGATRYLVACPETSAHRRAVGARRPSGTPVSRD